MSKNGFKELRVWQRAKQLAVSIYKLLGALIRARRHSILRSALTFGIGIGLGLLLSSASHP